MRKLLRVGITHGDYNGIGYEIVFKALETEGMKDLFTPVFFGDPNRVNQTLRWLGIEIPHINTIKSADEIEDGVLNIFDIGVNASESQKKGTPESGAAAVKALEMAVAEAMANTIDCLVTAPISKEAVQSASFSFPGQTEFLADRTQSEARMILFDDKLRVSLLTTHLPIAKVPESVTVEAIQKALRSFNSSLQLDFGIRRPRIAVLSLNPHCGDGGLLGNEEIETIIPAIRGIQEEVLAFGPFAADGFFSTDARKKFDGVLAMYHDQGLAPFKALAGPWGVNFTAGLPFVRTSPDHGTAFDIAGANVADPTSMRQALYAAVDLTMARRRNQEAAANPLVVQPQEKSDKRERKNDKLNIQ